GGPRLLGKRADGSFGPAAAVLHLPYLLLSLGVWHLAAAARGSRDASLVAPGLWVGRRPRPSDVPADVTTVVDLTAELPARRAVRRRGAYVAFPILDGHVPPTPALVALARRLAADPGVVYVHCAQGHGRAGLVAACVLVARGLAADPAGAVRLMRFARPKVRLTRSQSRRLKEVVAVLRPSGTRRQDGRPPSPGSA
ncbi:MAG: hypothetical protein JWO31_2024, partial [Phycisphaerales bacterium]|nr:hypothetical protein [Phycisphaerales bacterium]